MDDIPPPGPTNIPEYTVSEISGAVKRTLEGTFGRVRVRGEITELKRYASGHIYLSLKDESAKISGVVWKFSVPRLGMVPENGVEVIATGKISAYGERSSYQLVIERLEYAGAGALLARIEMLRQRLAQEGLFDAARKRTIPALPRTIGVISSERGAVIQDIRTTVARRFPRPILLWPVPVQGEGAAARIAAAIEGFGRLPPDGTVPRPDVLIVARGGGSLEDLMAFNDEAVVRAAAACPIPLISAVGHETDTTLIDHAADRRAPTPTAAAELAVPLRSALLADLQHTAARLSGGLMQLIQHRRMALRAAERLLPDLPSLAGHARQRVDDRAIRLRLALPGLLSARRGALLRAERGLTGPEALIATARRGLREQELRLGSALPRAIEQHRGKVHLCGLRLLAALRHGIAGHRSRAQAVFAGIRLAPLKAQLREARAQMEGCGRHLDALSYQAVLRRGFTLVLDPDGHVLTSAQAVKPAARLRLRFADGEVGARAEGAGVRRTPGKQASLPLD